MPTVQVTGVQVVAIYVTDLERAKQFYMQQLGMTGGDEMPPGVLLKAGEDTIYLEGGRAPRDAEPLKQVEVSVCLGVPSVKAAADALEAAGVSVVSAYHEFGPEFAMLRITDPDGNVIEFAGAP